MKKRILYIVILFSFSCTPERYVDETCVGNKALTQVGNLNIGDTLPGFTGYTSKGTRFSLKESNKDKVYIFFKTKENPLGFCINDEIVNEEINKMVQKRSVDLLVGLDLKIAGFYGLNIQNGKIEKSVLFIADKNKAIEKIYEDICEKDIVHFLNEEKTL